MDKRNSYVAEKCLRITAPVEEEKRSKKADGSILISVQNALAWEYWSHHVQDDHDRLSDHYFLPVQDMLIAGINGEEVDGIDFFETLKFSKTKKSEPRRVRKARKPRERKSQTGPFITWEEMHEHYANLYPYLYGGLDRSYARGYIPVNVINEKRPGFYGSPHRPEVVKKDKKITKMLHKAKREAEGRITTGNSKRKKIGCPYNKSERKKDSIRKSNCFMQLVENVSEEKPKKATSQKPEMLLVTSIR